jgi:hypothetical protein
MSCEKLEYVNCWDIISVGENVFVDCPALKTLDLPEVKEIGPYSLCGNKSLTEIDCDSDSLLEIISIGSRNESLNTVRISESVQNISNSFNECPLLTTIYCKAVIPPTLQESFNQIPDDAVIYVPAESVEAYQTAQGWSAFASLIKSDEYIENL